MLKLKQNYLLDPKNTKSDILSQLDCPDFPDGVWTDVILSRYIEFNQVYSGYYALDLDYKHTQSIGDIGLVINAGNRSQIVMPGFGAVRFRGPFCCTAHRTTGPVRNMCRTAHRTDPHQCGVVRKGSVHGAPGSNLLSWCGHGYPDVKSQRASFKPPN